MEWLRRVPQLPKQVFLVHGEPNASKVLAEEITLKMGLEVTIPSLGRSFDIL